VVIFRHFDLHNCQNFLNIGTLKYFSTSCFKIRTNWFFHTCSVHVYVFDKFGENQKRGRQPQWSC